MKCPYKRGDEMKCIDKDSSLYGRTGFVDSVGGRVGNGWELSLFGGLTGIWSTDDLQHVGTHPRIGQGLFGSDKS